MLSNAIGAFAISIAQHFQNSPRNLRQFPINSTQNSGYEKDLNAVVEKIQALHPSKNIAIIARCATVDPAISVAHHHDSPKISLILDRGHGNVYKLARSLTIFARLPYVVKILRKEFDCEGESKISQIQGKIFFAAPPPSQDQLMDYRGGNNLTRDLQQARGNVHGDQWVELPHNLSFGLSL